MSASAATGMRAASRNAERRLCPRLDVIPGMRIARSLPCAFLAVPGAARAADPPVVVAVVDSGRQPDRAGARHRLQRRRRVDRHRGGGGHGTGVAQVVAATCGGCRIMPVRIADESGSSTQGIDRRGDPLGGGARGTRDQPQLGARRRGALDRAGGARDRRRRRPRRDGHARRDERRLARPEPQPLGEPEPRRGSRRGGRRRRDGCCPRRTTASGSTSARVGRRPRTRRPASRARPRSSSPRTRSSTGSRCGRRSAAGARRQPALDVGWHCLLDVDGAVKAAASPVPVYRLAVSKAGKRRRRRRRLGRGDPVRRVLRRPPRRRHGRHAHRRPDARQPLPRWRGACRGTKPSCTLRIAGPTTAVAVFVRR